MASGGKKWSHTLRKWLDEWQVAFSGLLLATRRRRFIVAFLLSFVIFGTLMSLLSGSSAAFDLFWHTDLAGKFRLLGNGFLGIFGVGRSFLDWALIFFVTILQSILIGLVAVSWQKKQHRKVAQVAADAQNADNVQSTGLAVGLAVLGSGCPTCGTTLLAPVIGTIFSTSSFALAGIISGLLTAAAIIVSLLTFKRIGGNVYAQLISEDYLKRKTSAKEENG